MAKTWGGHTRQENVEVSPARVIQHQVYKANEDILVYEDLLVQEDISVYEDILVYEDYCSADRHALSAWEQGVDFRCWNRPGHGPDCLKYSGSNLTV